MSNPNKWFKWSQLLFGAVILALVAQAQAAAPQATAFEPGSPGAVVQQVTDEMMAIIQNGQQALKDDPEKYFQSLETVLEKTVHFDYISKFVMGEFWAGAKDEQRQAFAKRFKRSMVETIGKGLANYTDLKLIINPDEVKSKKNVAIVKQDVMGGKDPISISYWMAKSKTGDWKLIDVVLDGVKLRETFRSQFKAEMGKNGNDYDKVIANWSQT